MKKLQLENIAKDNLLSVIRTWFTDEREQAHAEFIEKQKIEKLCFKLSDIMDHLISSLFLYFSNYQTIKSMAVIATGGYGRREQCPYSDVDLLFLYNSDDVDDSKESAKIVQSTLYALWDVGIKVGQAHRSINENFELAKTDMKVRAGLLDARLIIGDSAIFSTCTEKLRRELLEHTTLAFVEAKLAERDKRHARFGDSRYMLEPNIKEGKGGLRDLHNLRWLARHAYEISTLDDLCKIGNITSDEIKKFHKANWFLLRVRANLHYLSEHADEQLTFDKQQIIAGKMGYVNKSANLAITRFMRRYFMNAITVGNLTRIFCALLEDEKKRKPQKPLGWVTLTNNESEWFMLDGERLGIRDENLFAKQPSALLKIFHLAQEQSLDIHPNSLRVITRNLHLIDNNFRKNPANSAIFLRILQSAKNPEITLRRMNEAGVLGRFIPEFGRIIGQTQFNRYHVYTVDEHTLVALGILHAIDQGKIVNDAPLASSIMPRITQKHVLYLAILCHDIAKGRKGDHSEIGEKIATKLGKNFGFSDEEAETAAWLVRQHLLLSATAFKRDLNDPKTIVDFVAEVRTSERLKLLLVLTVADIRAVAPGVWNEWKASLMRDLFYRAMKEIGSLEEENKRTPVHLQESIKSSISLASNLKNEAIDLYLEIAKTSGGFLTGCSIKQHTAIAPMLLELLQSNNNNETNSDEENNIEASNIEASNAEKNKSGKFKINITHDDKNSVTELIIVMPDQRGLFAQLSGAITLAGANIIHAKIFTLKDGTAIDIFHLQNKSNEAFNRPSMLAKMAIYIEQTIAGNLDLVESLAHRAKPYEKHSNYIPTNSLYTKEGTVFFENNASNLCSVIEISARDRIGLLYDVTQTINELGLSIATAHISTYGTQAADVFYVKDSFGMKIIHPERIKEIRDTIAAVL